MQLPALGRTGQNADVVVLLMHVSVKTYLWKCLYIVLY